jgi:uncharacterized protein (TIGR02444 family)
MSGRGSELWAFSLTVYANSEVQKECLDLQDRCGLDVNLLLFCTFVGAYHRAQMSRDMVGEAAEFVGTWHKGIVINLREARRALKTFATGTLPPELSSARLRNDIKALELEAERFEQSMLEAWVGSRIAQWPRTEPREAIVHNVRTLFAACVRPPAVPSLPDHLVEAAVAAIR